MIYITYAARASSVIEGLFLYFRGKYRLKMGIFGLYVLGSWLGARI